MKWQQIHRLYYGVTRLLLLKMHPGTMPESGAILGQDFQIDSLQLWDAALCYTNGKVSISIWVNNEQFSKCYPYFPSLDVATDFSCDSSHSSLLLAPSSCSKGCSIMYLRLSAQIFSLLNNSLQGDMKQKITLEYSPCLLYNLSENLQYPSLQTGSWPMKFCTDKLQ